MKRLFLLFLLLTFTLNLAHAQDIELDPQYAVFTVSDDFDTPYRMEVMTQNEAVNLNTLDCTGFVSDGPTFQIEWRSNQQIEGSLTFIFSNFNRHSDAVLYIQVVDAVKKHRNVWCNDDADGTLNPMIEVRELSDEAVIYVWVGSYHPDEMIEGFLYIYPENPLHVAQPSLYGNIFEQVTTMGPLDLDLYCAYRYPTYTHVEAVWDMTEGDGVACFVEEGQPIRQNLDAACKWQYGMNTYPVQQGDPLTWACFWHGDKDASTPEIMIAPKPDYTNW